MSAPTRRISELLHAPNTGEQVRVRGWIRTRRDSKGGFSFLELNDGSCFSSLQLVADNSLENYESEVLRLSAGCCIEAEGALVESAGKGQAVEIQAGRIRVLGWADSESYPLQKKRHSFEFLRTIAHLRPRTNTFAALSRIRNVLSKAIHDFFQTHGFVYLHTPIITGSDCEGAGELFRVTTQDLDHVAREGEVRLEDDFFGKSAFLTVSGQLEAEAYALALGRVYTFGPTFRAENSNTPRHLAEFWMIEPEMAFFDLDDTAALAEDFLKALIRSVIESSEEDLALFARFVDKTIPSTLDHVLKTPFQRVTYTDAVEILSKSGRAFEFPAQWGDDLQSEHERFLCEEAFRGPVIITDYPKSIKPFYMRVNDDNKTVAAMDVLVPRVGEIIGGSQREERLEVLLARMRETGMPAADYWWYVDLRKYGTAPHSGFGLGLDRLVQFVTGMANIRDVIPFPRTPKHVEF